MARGTEFFIAFPQHSRNATPTNTTIKNLTLIIWNPNSKNITAKLYFKNLPTLNKQISLMALTASAQQMPNDLQLYGSTKQNKSVYITASSPVEVQVLSSWEDLYPKSMGSFLALPREVLSQEYVIATHCTEEHCFLVVVTTENTTDVIIDLRISEGGNLTYNSLDYKDGDVVTTTGDAGDVIQILCFVCDLSGTRVRASKNVSVIAGGQFTTVSKDGNDMVVEQFLPWSNFGQRYVLAADLLYPISTETVKVVTNSINTTFRFQNNCYTSVRARQTFQITRSSNTFVEILASQKILVARFAEPRNIGDGVMIIASPVTNWATSYELNAFTQNSNQTHLVLIVEKVTVASLVIEVNKVKIVIAL